MKKWTGKGICSSTEYLHPVLLPKVEAVMRDVQGHFDPALIRIVLYETGRSLAKQREYLRKGTTWTLNSQHLMGRAADIVPAVWSPRTKKYSITWKTVYGKDGRPVWELIKASAKAHGLVTIPADGPHVQLAANVPDKWPGW